MKTLTNIILLLSLCSCTGTQTQDKPLAAQSVAVDARAAWEKSVRPIAIKISDAPKGLEEVCVYTDIEDALPEERQAFHGARFKRSGNTYTCDNPNAVTSDSTSALAICYPVREGLSPNTPLSLAAPFNENLVGIERNRIDTISGYAYVSEVEMVSAMAVLQLVTESDDIRDKLHGLRVYGDGIATAGTFKPYSGEWSELSHEGYVEATDAGCLMSNGREHNLYLVPTTNPTSVQIFATVNSREMSVKTNLPPMAAGSLTRLHLRKECQSLKISGSWVATKRPIVIDDVCAVDTAMVGHYLRKDGYVVSQLDSLCVAMVIETDGRHGKAVAINDCDETFMYGSLATGHTFPTIDGERTEGLVNPPYMKNLDPSNVIAFMPGMAYNPDCALGYSDGAELTNGLLSKFGKPDEQSMLMPVKRCPASYVPSLAEMVSLYYRFNPVKGSYDYMDGIQPLSGDYLTSSESSATSFWTINFDKGIITGNASKQYAREKLRLFYLF